MKQYHLTNKAIQDLDEIWIYTVNKWSEKQAKHPTYLDRNYDEIFVGLYCRKCNKHLIFYHLVDNEVEVVRILHQKMDIYSKFD